MAADNPRAAGSTSSPLGARAVYGCEAVCPIRVFGQMSYCNADGDHAPLPGDKSGDTCFWTHGESNFDSLVGAWDRLVDSTRCARTQQHSTQPHTHARAHTRTRLRPFSYGAGCTPHTHMTLLPHSSTQCMIDHTVLGTYLVVQVDNALLANACRAAAPLNETALHARCSRQYKQPTILRYPESVLKVAARVSCCCLSTASLSLPPSRSLARSFTHRRLSSILYSVTYTLPSP